MKSPSTYLLQRTNFVILSNLIIENSLIQKKMLIFVRLYKGECA